MAGTYWKKQCFCFCVWALCGLRLFTAQPRARTAWWASCTRMTARAQSRTSCPCRQWAVENQCHSKSLGIVSLKWWATSTWCTSSDRYREIHLTDALDTGSARNLVGSWDFAQNGLQARDLVAQSSFKHSVSRMGCSSCWVDMARAEQLGC